MRWAIPLILLAFILFVQMPAVAETGYTTVGEADVINRVITMAPDTMIAREQLGVTEADYLGSKSIFDTHLSANSDYTRDEFAKSSNFFGTRTDTANWDIGLGKKLPIGTETGLNWTNQRTKLFGVPTISGTTIFPTAPTYDSILQFSATQPLMKNFGGMNDRNLVAQAKKALQAADYNTKYRIALVAHSTLGVYWKWVIQRRFIVAWEGMVSDSQRFLKITLERYRLGTVEETDVLAAKANLKNRENGLLRAEKTAKQIEKEFKVLLAYSEYENIRPLNKFPHKLSSVYTNKEEAISVALANRWDYLAQKEDVGRLNIEVVSTKNKRWPELDLVGTMAVNGLQNSYGNAMSSVNNPMWEVGMTLSIPLENRAARSAYKRAGHEKAKAVTELKKKENDIANSISELLTRLNYDKSVLDNAQVAETLQREKLIQELEKYEYGRSNSEMIVLYQNDRLLSQVSTLTAWMDYIQTILDLRLAENTLIDL